MEEEKRTLDRRRFTVAAALAALSGVAITISSGCGSDSSPTGGTGGPGGDGSKNGVISNNHGHTAVITSAQLTAGGALELNIQGAATHRHTVQLSAAEIGAVAAGQQVSKESSNDESHTHTVTFN